MNFYRRLPFETYVMVVLCLCFGGGCVSSPSYHIGVLVGSYKARPLPLVRYWAEYSRKEFTENIVYAPLVGVPGIVPVGYLGDVITDVVCLPADLILCWFSSEPKVDIRPYKGDKYTQRRAGGKAHGVNIRPHKDDKYTIEVSDIRNVELHWDLSRTTGRVPIAICVKQGTLLVRIVDSESRSIDLQIGTDETQYIESKIDGRQRTQQMKTPDGKWLLTCFPPVPMLPPAFPFGVFFDDLAYPPSMVSLRPWSEATAHAWRTSFPWGVSYGVRFIPSSDFVGEVTYQGKSINNIIFNTPQWHWL